MERFVAQLKAKQNGETDSGFAARLGVSQGQWTRLKNGQRPVMPTFARTVIAIWPDLEPVYLDCFCAWLHAPATPADQA